MKYISNAIRIAEKADGAWQRMIHFYPLDVLFLSGYDKNSGKYIREHLPEFQLCVYDNPKRSIDLIDVESRLLEIQERGSMMYFRPDYAAFSSSLVDRLQQDFWKECTGSIAPLRYGGFLGRVKGTGKVFIFEVSSPNPKHWIDEYREYISLIAAENQAVWSGAVDKDFSYEFDDCRNSDIPCMVQMDEDSPSFADKDFSYEFDGCLNSDIPCKVQLIDDWPSSADENFYHEVRKIEEEIRERIEKLRLCGVDERIIESLFKKEPQPSRLVITEDYRILLPDYGNIEINMEPLTKAVYLLFLHHPEGIIFKELPYYRKEFSDIYNRLTNRVDLDVIEDSINKVLDPTRNTINERCSRIREAFIRQMDEETIAYRYTICCGDRFTKYIPLDRQLVEERYITL